jgi:DNA (cytosine-5)-methyltransferase 1
MNAVELFAGAGGLAQGVEKAGFTHLAVVERDRWACDTLAENTDWPLLGWARGDVRDVDYAALAGRAHLVSGGPPCQPFSMGGQHRAFLDPRDMFPEAARAVRALRPAAFIFENVKGLRRQAFANYLDYIRLRLRHPDATPRAGEPWLDHLARLEDLETSGGDGGLLYNVVIRLLNAADFGVPQRRERLFIVGLRDDLAAPFHFPEATHAQDALLWSKWRSGAYWARHGIAPVPDAREQARAARLTAEPRAQPWRTVRDALRDLPDPEFDPEAAAALPDHRFVPGARAYPGHTGSPLDQPAKTLKAGVHGVPGGENMLRRPDGSIRYFTVRECARLQTFPDDFRFHGAWSETMRQLGNAVPVDLAAVVARTVLACIRPGAVHRAMADTATYP